MEYTDNMVSLFPLNRTVRFRGLDPVMFVMGIIVIAISFLIAHSFIVTILLTIAFVVIMNASRKAAQRKDYLYFSNMFSPLSGDKKVTDSEQVLKYVIRNN